MIFGTSPSYFLIMVRMNCAQNPKALLIYIFSSVGGSCTSFRNCMFWPRSRLCVIVDGIVSLCWQIQRLSNADN